MNKKIVYIFVFLTLALFLSACADPEVGRNVAFSKTTDDGGAQALMPREGDREVEPSEETTIQILEVSDTIAGITLESVDANGDSCTVDYQDTVYTINTGSLRTMPNGITVGVIEPIPSDRENIPDYCKIVIMRGNAIYTILQVSDTIAGVTLESVDANGDSCTVDYQDTVYTINTGSLRTMPNGGGVIVFKPIPSDRENIPDYCALVIT